MGNEKYVDRGMQTLNGAAKNKLVQSDSMIMVDTGQTHPPLLELPVSKWQML